MDTYPTKVFINSKNTIYALRKEPGTRIGKIVIWDNASSTQPPKRISGSLHVPHAIFVANNDDIYVDNGVSNGRVDKWIAETGTWTTAMYVPSECRGLFIDIYDNLYCSLFSEHQVVRKWLNDTTNTITVVAGTGVNGSESDMLDRPYGIFVNINLDLYVADQFNGRIQLFRVGLGQLNGTTVAGRGSSPATITLGFPTDVILDGDGYIFIVDCSHHRIYGSDKHGFRCIFGCFGHGSASNQLIVPNSISFDSYGNIYVTDQNNHRVQKVLRNNDCGKLESNSFA